MTLHDRPEQIAHYRVRRAIGAGGMADVFEAEDVRTGTVVALKVLASHFNTTSEAVARFVREGRALQNMRHANIVRVLDHGVTEAGDAWIALERLQGVTLDALIRDEGQLEPARAARFVRDIAKALAMVHARGLIHRDIKPENVFVVLPDTPQEHAKLIDFGIARVSKAELGEHSVIYTRVNSMLGTAAFAAPEQMAGAEITSAADVFALGVTAYEMLTGALPFAGESVAEQLKSKAAGRIVPLEARVRRREALDPAFAAFVTRCIQVDPAARPRDGLAVLSELAALVERAGPASIARPASTSRARPQGTRRWVVVGVVAFALWACAIAAFLVLRQR